MAGALPAYDYPQHEYVRGNTAPRPQPRVRIVHGQRRPQEVYSPSLAPLMRPLLALLLVVAVLACARIAINALTVQEMMRNDAVVSEISNIRQASAALEVDASTAGNPTNLQKNAKHLGMQAPASTETLMIGQDVVAYDDEGNLSLSKSLAVAAEG